MERKNFEQVNELVSVAGLTIGQNLSWTMRITARRSPVQPTTVELSWFCSYLDLQRVLLLVAARRLVNKLET